MQGFSGKILPAGLEIFTENRRLDLAFPSNPGITFAPRTEMTTWCAPERRENGGKRKWRQIRQENFKREIRKREMDTAGSMKPGKPPSGKYDFVCLAERVRSDIQNHSSGLPAVCDGLFHSWIGRSHTAFRLRLKGTAKKKNRQKPVKAPLWHKHKRNGPCIISLNCCLGVRQSPFLRLCGSRHTFVQNPFGRWCADG